MTDVITRFKLETTAFDSKLRDAAKGLQAYGKQAELAGKEFTNFSQKAVEAARSLGTIASGATNTKDKLKDLVGAYNDVARAYNNLTEQQRQTDFGKAMSASLEQLQVRIRETKEELYSLSGSGSGGLFGGKGLTDMMSVFGGNLLAQGATKLVSELKDTVQQSIELARAGEGVRIAFERLNQPGLLDKLKEATHGTVSEVELMKQAIKFENFKLPLEDLATYLAFAQQKAKDTGESVDYMVNSITTGLGRQSKQILDNLGISAAELTKRMNEGADMTTAVAEIIRDEMAKAGDYVETAADRAARAAADASNKMEALGHEAIPVAEAWAETWNSLKTGGMELLNFVLAPIAESIREINRLLGSTPEDLLTEAWEKAGGLVGDDIDDNGNYIKGTITSMPEITVSGKKPKKKKKSGGSKKVSTPELSDFSKMLRSSMGNTEDLKGKAQFMSVFATMTDEAKEKMLGLNAATVDLGGAMAELGNNEVLAEIDAMTRKLEQQKSAMNMAGQAAQNFGSALAGLEDPAAKAAGTVISAIANIALGFGMATAQASELGPYGWIAYVAAGLATMATAISTIHSLTGYAEGGFVRGNNSYSGDNVPIMANEGELVLTKAMQGNLASQMRDNGGFGDNFHAVLTGENIHIVHSRYLKRTGQGELVTWR